MPIREASAKISSLIHSFNVIYHIFPTTNSREKLIQFCPQSGDRFYKFYHIIVWQSIDAKIINSNFYLKTITNAQVIAAEGEQKASRALREAAEVIAESPSALQLRWLTIITFGFGFVKPSKFNIV